MIKSLLLSLMLMFSTLANADLLTVTWVQPTTREDGTALTTLEIKNYRLVWSVKGVAQPDRIVPVGTSYVLDTGTLSGRTCGTLRTVDVDGLESDPSNQSCRNSNPKAPTTLLIK